MESYSGYNIVHYRDFFYGIHQSLGSVDLTLEVTEFTEEIEGNFLIIGDSISQIRLRIDVAMLTQAKEEARAKAEALEGQLTALQSNWAVRMVTWVERLFRKK